MKYLFISLLILLSYGCSTTSQDLDNQPKWQTLVVSSKSEDDAIFNNYKVVLTNYIYGGVMKEKKKSYPALISIAVTYLSQIESPIILIDLYYKEQTLTINPKESDVRLKVKLKNDKEYFYDLTLIDSSLILNDKYDTKELIYFLQTEESPISFEILVDDMVHKNKFTFKIFTNNFEESYKALNVPE